MSYKTTYHDDETVTVWDVHEQSWVRTRTPSDRVLASLSVTERARVLVHCGTVESRDGMSIDDHCGGRWWPSRRIRTRRGLLAAYVAGRGKWRA